MKKQILLNLLLVCILAIMLQSCCWVQKGAGIGAVGGAIIGAVSTSETGPGAAAGAVAGGLLGALIGDYFDHDKCEKEILILKKKIAELESQLAEKDKIIGEKDKEIARLKDLLAQKENEIAALKKEIEDLKKELEKYKIGTSQEAKLFCISLSGDILFASGSSKLTDSGKEVLDKVAETLKNKYSSREIMIEGHTDSMPIKSMKSNWELGSARSLSVLHYLLDEKGMDPTKLFASTYGEFRPVSDNVSEEGKAKNRRVEIVILPEKIERKKAE